MVFRVLAGILAAFLLLCGLPMALHEVFTGSGEHRLWGILLAIGSVYSGVGLAVGARTGRWFKSACLVWCPASNLFKDGPSSVR
jgi:hypothetical protein